MSPDEIQTSSESETELASEMETLGSSALFSFEGRINRGTFWKITVLNFVFGTVATLIGARVFWSKDVFSASAISVVATVLLGGITAWQSFATQVKRWHDLGKAGTMALLNFIPVVNFFAFLYLGLQEGVKGPNEYGEGPHDISIP